jgi:ribose 1,5-bisphosphokinase PhnN
MGEMIYVVGAPGVGKSTTVDALTMRCYRRPVAHPFSYDVLSLPNAGGMAVELGMRRMSAFSGTDALAMNVQPKVLSWLAEGNYQLVIGEGDRLGNAKFFDAALHLGWKVTLIALTLPQEILDRRHAYRGAVQNPSWRRGRQTKVWNLVAWAREQQERDISVVELSVHRPTAEVVEALRLLVPTLRRFA